MKLTILISKSTFRITILAVNWRLKTEILCSNTNVTNDMTILKKDNYYAFATAEEPLSPYL